MFSGRESSFGIFPLQDGALLHFTDSKSECPGYPLMREAGVQMTGA